MFQAHIDTEFGGTIYQRAKTLEEAIAKCKAQKSTVKIVKRYVTKKGVVVWQA